MTSSNTPKAAIARSTSVTASADIQAADLVAEERSEDDGMREHADKASDPIRWAARRNARGAIG